MVWKGNFMKFAYEVAATYTPLTLKKNDKPDIILIYLSKEKIMNLFLHFFDII